MGKKKEKGKKTYNRATVVRAVDTHNTNIRRLLGRLNAQLFRNRRLVVGKYAERTGPK